MGSVLWSEQGLAPPFSQVAKGPRCLGGTEGFLMVGSRGWGQGGPGLSGHRAEGGSTAVTSLCLW